VTTMKVTVLTVHVKATKQIRVVVTERATVMGLGTNGYMSYRLGVSYFFSLFRTIHGVMSQYVKDTLTHCTEVVVPRTGGCGTYWMSRTRRRRARR
jgi:hypothetical protein